MKMIPFRACILPASVFLLISCWLPPYDPALNDSVRLAEKFGSPALSFTVSARTWDAEGGYYLPPRDPSGYREGYWIVRRDNDLRIKMISRDTTTQEYFLNDRYGWSDTELYGESCLLVPSVSNSGDLYVYVRDDRGFVLITRNSDGSLSPSDLSSGGTYSYIGMGHIPVDGTTDRFFRVVPQSAYLIVERYAAAVSFSSESSYSPVFTLGEPSSPSFAAIDASGALYFSSEFADGSAATYRWASAPYNSDPDLLAFIDKRVNGMLADGRLIAKDSDGLTVYDPSDESSFRITTGTIRFVFERHDSAAASWVSVFTRITADSVSKDDSPVDHRIEIYEIPSADLKSLAD